MKAFLLAAGIGSRLRPITDSIPKCMVTIAGRPLLEIWLDSLHRAGVDDVLINLHHFPDVVEDHVSRRSSPPAVRTVHEPELLGSAGTLAANRQWVDDDDMFLACYADNLTDFDVRQLIDFHREGDAVASLALFHSERPSAGGVVDIDDHNRVIGFVEKPSHPASDLVNAGIYAFRPCVLDLIEGPPPKDIGFDLLPRVVGQARAMVIDGYFRDIGTLGSYWTAQMDWQPRTLR